MMSRPSSNRSEIVWCDVRQTATGLRIDLLFDFPLPAASLVKNAVRLKIRSHVFRIASEPDLLRLTQIALTQRSAPGDAEDVAFLEARRTKKQ